MINNRLMPNYKSFQNKKILLKIFIIFLTSTCATLSKETTFFNEGKSLFSKQQYEKSKFFFEKDIVFNPKSEKSYLYLAKIFNKKDNEEDEEINLNNVLLINPDNDEALYMLILMKIKQSDFKRSEELISKFNLVCKSFCSKNIEIQEKLNKILPKDEKDNN